MTNHDDRIALRQRGSALREELHLSGAAEQAPGVAQMLDELVFGALWSRPGLSKTNRMVATLASLAALERRDALSQYALAAAHVGVDAMAVREIVLQAGLYTGFVAADANLRHINPILGEPELDTAHGPDENVDLLSTGIELMEQIHGERARGGYASGEGAPAKLYDLAIRYGYGLLWNRPGLSREQRFVTTVAVFASLEQHVQLRKFAQSAMDNGLDYDAVVEIVMQIAPYCGFPRSLNGLMALERLND